MLFFFARVYGVIRPSCFYASFARTHEAATCLIAFAAMLLFFAAAPAICHISLPPLFASVDIYFLSLFALLRFS